MKHMANREKRHVDPNMFIPEGIPPEEWDYTNDSPIGYDYETVIDEGVDSSEDDGLGVVDTLTVVSQKIRRVKGEGKVVDIIVEVDAVPGADKYEFRVVKA